MNGQNAAMTLIHSEKIIHMLRYIIPYLRQI